MLNGAAKEKLCKNFGKTHHRGLKTNILCGQKQNSKGSTWELIVQRNGEIPQTKNRIDCKIYEWDIDK